jgi:hypothetical protein
MRRHLLILAMFHLLCVPLSAQECTDCEERWTNGPDGAIHSEALCCNDPCYGGYSMRNPNVGWGCNIRETPGEWVPVEGCSICADVWVDGGTVCNSQAVTDPCAPPDTPPGGEDTQGDPNPENNSPIIINLAGGPYRLSGVGDPVTFDIDADGVRERITWTLRNSDIAFLAMDRNHNGAIDSGAELFGNYTVLRNGEVATNGFEALADLDSNLDGLIDQRDAVWPKLLLWRDLNHDGMSQADEITKARRSSMNAIETEYHWTAKQDAAGNLFKYKGHIRVHHDRLPIYDVFFVSLP